MHKGWLFLIASCLAMVACASPSSPAAAPSGAAPAAAPAGPKLGGRLTLDIAFDPTNWDTTTTNRRQSYYTAHSMSRLLQFKSGPDVKFADLTLAPEVAEKWEISPDAKSFKFTLRKGVKWQNLPPVNGRELTSADVKFTMEYVGRIGEVAGKSLQPSNETWTVAGLSSVDTPDPYTAVVNFKEPFAPYLSYTSSVFLSLLPREIYDRDGKFDSTRVGSGPYILDSQGTQAGSRVVWKKNPTYWEPGKPYLDEIVQLVLPDEGTARAAFRTKQLDMLTERISVSAADEIKKGNPEAVMFPFNRPGPYYVWISQKPGQIFANDKLRKAFSLATDREAMITGFANGQGEMALAGALPDTFTPAETKGLLKYDPEQAKRLLAEAGYPNGLSVDLIFPGAAYGDTYVSLLQLLQAQVKKVGFTVNLKSMGSAELLGISRTGDFALAGGGTVGLFGDADSNLFGSWHPASGNNVTKVNDPVLTALVEAQRREADPVKRKELIRQTVRMINENVNGYITFFREPTAYFWHPYVKGQYPNFTNAGTSYTPYITETWIDK